jgi:hypothetical protein
MHLEAVRLGQALVASRNYTPNQLIELLGREDMPKPTILEVIAAQKSRFTVRDLLQHAYSQEANATAALFRIVAERQLAPHPST